MDEPTPRECAFAWMTGWKTGAAFLPIPDEYQKDRCSAEIASLFSSGWEAGRVAKKAATAECARITGYTFGTVSLLDVARHYTGDYSPPGA